MAFLRAISSFRTKLQSAKASYIHSQHSRFSGTLKYSEEVQQAKLDGSPILALESTIITHGMPYPHNLETVLQVENIIRDEGATPATIAILGGDLTVGLSEDELKYLASAKGVVKTSRRDLAPIIAANLDGATTVAATIVAAELADIAVFATGGIGGVHRAGENTLDVSADLSELARSRTLVVCSGVKSILDIRRTLEYLETQGVCVCSFGDSYEFPAFYTARSGHLAPHRVASAVEAARVLHASRRLRLGSGVVVAVPVPPQHAMDESIIENAISKTLEEANDKGIRGKEITPFILAAVAKATGGASLDANIALIKNNARVGANIAVEFNKLNNFKNGQRSDISPASKQNVLNSNMFEHKPNNTRQIHTSASVRSMWTSNNERAHVKRNDRDAGSSGPHLGPVVVIGGANVDRTYKVTEGDIKLDGSTHPCSGGLCAGGVGRNVAEALWRLRGPGAVRLVTAIGDDADGHYLHDLTPGLITKGSFVKGGRTPSYAAVLDPRGECSLGLGDMTLHQRITTEMISSNIQLIESASLVVMDGNPPLATVEYVLQLCDKLRKPVFFEPTDRRKASKPFVSNHKLAYATPNQMELIAIASTILPNLQFNLQHPPSIDMILKLCTDISESVKCIVVTLGGVGVIVHNNNNGVAKARLYGVEKIQNLRNVSGAGDCFAGGFIHGLLSGFQEEHCVALGMHTAQQALLCDTNVPKEFGNYKIIQKAVYTNLI